MPLISTHAMAGRRAPAAGGDAGSGLTPRQKKTLGKIVKCCEALEQPLPLQPFAVYGASILAS